LLGSFECTSLSALLKCTAAIKQAGLGSQTIRSGTVAFNTLLCVIEVAYIFASVKAITVKFLVWQNTTGKELQLLEFTSKVTTEFAFNVISRGLHKEHYCRIDTISELKCIQKMRYHHDQTKYNVMGELTLQRKALYTNSTV